MKTKDCFEPTGLMRRAYFAFGFLAGAVASTGLIAVSECRAETTLGAPVATTIATENSTSMIRLEPLDAESQYPPVVTAMAVSSDQQWLVAAGDDHALRVIRLSNGEAVATLEGHRDWVQAVAFDEQTSDILSCGKDGELRRWMFAKQWESDIVHQGEVALMAMDVHPSKRIVACAGFGPEIWIYSLESNQLIAKLDCSCADSRALAFSNSGDKLACGGRDGTLRLWDWEKTRLIREQALHRDRIRSIQFSNDDAEIITIGEDRRAIGYRYGSDQVVLDQTLATGRLLSMASVDAATLAIAGSDNTIRLVRMSDGLELNRLIGHEGSVAVMVIAGQQLISGSFDTSIRIWDLGQAAQQRQSSNGRYEHPVSARFQDSGVGEAIR